MTRTSMRILALTLLVGWPAVLHAGDGGKDDPAEKSTWLHAKALGRELDGNIAEALTLLREAAALAPQDEDINFDLARLSFQTHDANLWSDCKNFLALTPTTQDARMLRAYLLGLHGDTESALRETSGMGEQNEEAAQLQLLLQRQNSEAIAPSQDSGKAIAVRASANAEVDTNVLVLPEDANVTRPGARMNVDAAVQWQPIRGDSEMHLTFTARTGTHVADREDLAMFDTESGALLLGGQTKFNNWTVYGDVEGTQIFIDDFRESFLRQVLADAQVLYEVANHTRVGAYGSGGPRWFIFGNPSDGFNRNGAIWEGGAMANWTQAQGAGLLASARVGYQGEYTTGNELRETGVTALAMLGYIWRDLSVSALMGYQMRTYAESTDDRLDHRLMPGARLAYAFDPHWTGVASYSYTDNISTSGLYAYNRHLGSLGVEALW